MQASLERRSLRHKLRRASTASRRDSAARGPAPSRGRRLPPAADPAIITPEADLLSPEVELAPSSKAALPLAALPLPSARPSSAPRPTGSASTEPLARDEEHDLAVAYADHGDDRAADRLVRAHLRLVTKIAGEYRRSRVNVEDLVQEGNLGLFMAVRKFDPHRGVKLSTYAGWWIRAYMLKFILDDSRLVRLGTTQAQRKLFFGLRKEQRKLSAQGIEPTPALIASRLHVEESEVVEMDRRLGQSEVSLDAPTRGEEAPGVSRIDRLEATAELRPDALAEERELLARLRQSLDRFRLTLTPRDKHILRRRILSESPDTLEEIGSHYGISRERARQLEARLSDRLKVFLTQELGWSASSMGPSNDASQLRPTTVLLAAPSESLSMTVTSPATLTASSTKPSPALKGLRLPAVTRGLATAAVA
jgi:RNA polymerase sigma-32 factor